DRNVTGVQTCALPICLQVAAGVGEHAQVVVAQPPGWELLQQLRPWGAGHVGRWRKGRVCVRERIGTALGEQPVPGVLPGPEGAGDRKSVVEGEEGGGG